MDVVRRRFMQGAAAAAALPVLSPAARAQAYPTRPIRFIVPLAPGGGLDFVARLFGEYLSRKIGQQIYIENKLGAGGMIGIETAAKSPPDGYSVLVTNDNVASAPHVLRVNTDYVKDLVPVIQLSQQTLVLAVHSSFEVKTVAELVAAAKAKPGMGFATSGVGSNQHILGEWFAKEAGIKLDHVPYRGAGQAVNDFIAGHILIGVLGPTALIPHFKTGTLRCLAQSVEASARKACPTCRPSRRPASRAWCWTPGTALSCRPARPQRSSRASMPSSTRRRPITPPATACCRPRPRRSAARRSSSPPWCARTAKNMPASPRS